MTTQTRPNVFETNSSSSHSLTIVTLGDLANQPQIPVVADYFDHHDRHHRKAIVLTGGEFGWQREDHRDPLTKANYLAVALRGGLDVDDPIKDAANQARWGWLVQALTEATGAESVVVAFSEKYDSPNGVHWGYIDHESTGVAFAALTDLETVRHFIFNPRSCLHLDNDNG